MPAIILDSRDRVNKIEKILLSCHLDTCGGDNNKPAYINVFR